jgi:hypothetical protein
MAMKSDCNEISKNNRSLRLLAMNQLFDSLDCSSFNEKNFIF